jgi:hypothetical protein
MKTYKRIILLTVAGMVTAASLLYASGAPVARSEDDGSTTLTFSNGQTFHLPPGKGLLGPSSDPTSQVPLSNEDGSLVAVNEQPMTKTSFVHLYIKGQGGRFTEIKDVNKKIRAALPASSHDISTEFIRVERVIGRTLDVETASDSASGSKGRRRFKIGVAANGTLSAAR